MIALSVSRLILLASGFLVAFANLSFARHVLEVYPFNSANAGFLISLALFLLAIIVLMLSLVCYRRTVKPVLVVVFMLSSATAYFMDSYNVIIDDTMILNVLSTDIAESLDLLSLKLLAYIAVLGALPSWLALKIRMKQYDFRGALISRAKLLLAAIAVIVISILLFGGHYASFFREHKPLRLYTNPVFPVYSLTRFAIGANRRDSGELVPIATDAFIPPHPGRELIIMVAGETARADRFSLNGYARETNPLLQQENVVSYTNVWSCGTSTAVSLPCEFSLMGRDDYDKSEARHTENLLDVLKRVGVNVLWRDNNSSSKGVASRITEQNFKDPAINPECDEECRDTGMLADLQTYIDAHPQGDIFIVLHQMGSHGPAYYRRYPKRFERFTPVCKTNQLENCTEEEIGNTYDNTILYTDYFLSRVIKLLKNNAGEFETVLFYVSDHGESLGENGLYLHGMPYFLAPDEQTHIPLIVWADDNNPDIDIEALRRHRDDKYTHDNIFHTVLGLLEIVTTAYQPQMDMIHGVQHR